MPETDVQFVERSEILDFEEIERFVRIAVGLGINKLRLTGGEPLVRRDLPVLIRRLAAIPGIRDMALTTNGVLLPDQAEPLYDAGLRRLNVHIDTLDRERFLQITRRDDLAKVLAGLAIAKRIGLLEDQAQRRRGEESGGARYRSAGPLRPRERLRSPLHRVHAARRAESLGPRQGAAGGRHHRDAFARDLTARHRFPTPIRAPLPPNTSMPMAAARSVSSLPSAGRFA